MSDTLPARRPAETVTLAGGVAVLIAYFAGIDDPEVVVAMATVVAALPALVTFIVELTRK
jgi:mannose/fructose/N-acetylgalactosamine-specific phosphotransferase system component IIC